MAFPFLLHAAVTATNIARGGIALWFIHNRFTDSDPNEEVAVEPMRIPESQFEMSPRGEAKLTSMPKRNRGSGTKTQIKMRRYKPAVPGKCKSGYFYDSKSRMCVLKSRR